MNLTTPLRYPGGKGKLTNFLKLIFEENGLLDGHYVEPYAGGSGLALNLLMLDYASCIHLNDLDATVFAFWHSVLNAPDEFCRRIHGAKMNMEEWERQRAIHRSPENHSRMDVGFATFYLNRTNRSGILTGGAIGGKQQAGEWKLDARFNKATLCRRIEKIAIMRSRIRLYNLDAEIFLKSTVPTLPEKSLVYLDPPYYLKAERLYKNIYRHEDHASVAALVKELKTPWIVSYDHMPEITQLYRGFRQITYGMNYSAADRYKGMEVMFFSADLSVPDVQNPSKLLAA